MNTTLKILGVPFAVGTASEVVERAVEGGLIVAPSAPVLVEMATKPDLQQAVSGADLAITDSGLMILLWRLIRRERLERVSGLEYLACLLARPDLRHPGTVLWVMPSTEARDRNLVWLQAQGFRTGIQDCYVAPTYPLGPLEDANLLHVIQEVRPKHVILALGGGVQERLGYFLRNSLARTARKGSPLSGLSTVPSGNQVIYFPGIHCIGAAIGFLSGDQVKIPLWADYFYLGWFFRCVSAPRRFIPRYCRALRLIPLLIRYRDCAPVGNPSK